MSDVKEAFEAITGCKQSVEGLHESWGPAGRKYAQSLADCWNDALKAKLATHAYIDKMPHYGFDFLPPALHNPGALCEVRTITRPKRISYDTGRQ
jgi:hypothetical protein